MKLSGQQITLRSVWLLRDGDTNSRWYNL